MIGTPGSDNPTGAQREAVLEWELSQVVALASEAVPRRCTTNAWRALICLPVVFFPHGEYVEGWIVYETGTQVVVVEHCWCELAPGQTRHIVDPSIVFLVERGQPVQYFPGVRRSWKETEALEGEWFPHVRFGDYGEDGMGHPAYRAAHDEAVRKGTELADISAPPKELAVHCAQLVPDADLEQGGDDMVILVHVVPSSLQDYLS
jgi:hypothetical protein